MSIEQFGDAVELKGYPEIINVMGLVEEGRLDATVQDVPVSVFYGHDFPGLHNVGQPVAPGYYVALRPHGRRSAARKAERSAAQSDERRHASTHLRKVRCVERRTEATHRSRARTGRQPLTAANLALGQLSVLRVAAAARRVDDDQARVPLDAAGDRARPARRRRPALRPALASTIRSKRMSNSSAARRCCCSCS